MRLSPDSNTSLIGRRRGTPRKQNLVLNQKSILVLAALCAAIFLMGLVVGTHIFGTPNSNATNNSNNNGESQHKNAESSPLAAATANKHLSENIQNLILESAKAELIEKQQHEQEVEALKHGNVKEALHLKGMQAPGDANYNPHHAVDDVAQLEVPLNEAVEVGEGDGAMYAGDIGDHVLHEEEKKEIPKMELIEKEDMHNHFAEAVKNEAVESEKKKSLREKLHDLKAEAAEVVKHGLRGAIGNIQNKVTTDSKVDFVKGESSYYPYMTLPVPENYDFKKYEPLGGGRFAEYKDGDSPYAITDKLKEQSDELARSRRVHVLNAMKHVWKNYKEKAFGSDELHPISGRVTQNWGGMGTTLVDALDTLWLMGLKDEFWEGRDWVRDKLSNTPSGDVSGFETTIRSLGGLLSAYDLSGDKAFLEKAEDLGSRLLKAYDTKSGLPHGSVNLQNGASHNFGWFGNQFVLAEVGTQQIEYRYLSHATGKDEYAKKADRVFDILYEIMPEDGLLGEGLKEDSSGGAFFSKGKVSFGAMGDSTYEYMIKLWIQSGRKEQRFREMWDKSMNGVHSQLVQKSNPNGLTYLADRENGRLNHKMDHLACFMGGALAIGAYTDPMGLDSVRAQRDLKTAKALTYTCYQMYARSATGISPEFVQFGGSNDFSIPSSAPFYILRPEVVEAFYYLSALTGDPIYRCFNLELQEWGWEVFQSIEKYCKTEYGYGSLKNVDNPSMPPEDRMESFFLAETMKYLYLLFDPDSEIDILNKHVFNTEAHPLKVFKDSN
eukprot:CCRYP_006741-RB/>CCRYP_006741-RB protein AED:0.04 eAED:0.04 QI:773/0.8/0.83/1/0.8/0.83/6/101/777